MAITGRDELSLKIINELQHGAKVKDVPKLFEISLDQAKRLSRYSNVLKQATKNLSVNAQNKIKDLGLKILYLSALFKNNDWEGLEEILSSTNEDTTVDELKLMVLALEEKRERIREFQNEVDWNLKLLESKEQKMIVTEQKLISIKKEIDKTLKKFKKYHAETKEFLIDHVGVYEDTYCLIKRVDSHWRNLLKKNKIIIYDEHEYVFKIPDLDTFVNEYERRSKRGRTEWDWEVEEKRYENSRFFLPDSEYYRKGTGLVSKSIKMQIQEVEKEIKENEKEKEQIQKEIKKLKRSSVKTFFEAVEKSNKLSTRELKLHGTLQDRAAKWLYSQGYIVATEVVLSNGRRADVIGFNEQKHIVMIEAKASRADFLRDKKWTDYLNYCDEFYFCIERYSMARWYDGHRRIDQYEGKTDAGLLELDNKRIEKIAVSLLEHQAKNKDAIIFTIMKSLSKKALFGY